MGAAFLFRRVRAAPKKMRLEKSRKSQSLFQIFCVAPSFVIRSKAPYLGMHKIWATIYGVFMTCLH